MTKDSIHGLNDILKRISFDGEVWTIIANKYATEANIIRLARTDLQQLEAQIEEAAQMLESYESYPSEQTVRAALDILRRDK